MGNKVVIIGCGNVGMSYAYALLNQRTQVSELVLVDVKMEKTVGEAMDLNHCLPYAPSKIKIKSGTYQDCFDAAIVCICAGANQEEGETRIDLIRKNAHIFKEIVGEVMATGFDGIFLVATNPVDAATYFTWKYSGLTKNRVIGSGTSLDTSRLRYLLGEKLQISSKNVHAYVIGEHGDSEFVPWTNAHIGLENIASYLSLEELEKIATQVKNAAYEIINRKGATYYGIGMCLVRITNAILGDENAILTVSSYDEENDIYNGFPCLINRQGMEKRMPLTLTLEEKQKWDNTVSILSSALEKFNQSA